MRNKSVNDNCSKIIEERHQSVLASARLLNDLQLSVPLWWQNWDLHELQTKTFSIQDSSAQSNKDLKNWRRRKNLPVISAMCEEISTEFIFSFFYCNRAEVGPSETIVTPWARAHLVLINKFNTNTHTKWETAHRQTLLPPLRKSLSTSELPIQLGSTHLSLIY